MGDVKENESRMSAKHTVSGLDAKPAVSGIDAKPAASGIDAKAVISGRAKSRVAILATQGSTQSTTGAKPMRTTNKSSKNVANRSMSRMKVRKHSYGFSAISGIRLRSRSSMGNVEYRRPPLIYLPTYQLETSLKFYPPHVLREMDSVITEMFTDHKYNVQETPALALKMSYEILRRVKALSFNRYRIISVVTMGQRRAQCYYNTVSFLWDIERDNCVTTHRELNTVFLQVTVFGIYLD